MKKLPVKYSSGEYTVTKTVARLGSGHRPFHFTEWELTDGAGLVLAWYMNRYDALDAMLSAAHEEEWGSRDNPHPHGSEDPHEETRNMIWNHPYPQ